MCKYGSRNHEGGEKNEETLSLSLSVKCTFLTLTCLIFTAVTTLPIKSHATQKEYAFGCGGDLIVNGELKVNGPLAHVYAGGDIRVGGKLTVTGDVEYGGEMHAGGITEITGYVGQASQSVQIPSPPSFEELKSEANYIFTGENGGTVYVYDYMTAKGI